MQAYHSSRDQPAYVYAQPPNQYGPPQTAYYAQYPQYPQYAQQAPVHQPQPNYPVYAASYEPSQQFPTPAPRRKDLSRSASSTPAPVPAGKPSAPLKSAMKRKKSSDRSAPAGGVPLSRHRTNSDARQRVNSQTRQRSNSTSTFVPGQNHLFLSLHGNNEIRIENILYQSLLDELRENLVTMWPQGIIVDQSRDHKWRLQFAGSPWMSSGIDFIFAGRLLTRLFSVLANNGYSYLTTVNAGKSAMPPRLIFVDSASDENCYFFLMALSSSGEKLSLLDAPADLAQQLSANLRAAFPRKVITDRAEEDGQYIIQIKRGGPGLGPDVDKSLFIAFVLRFLNSAGFKLDGSLAMGKRGFFSFGSKKEVWMFRGSMWRPRPESRQSHRSRQD